MKSVVIISSEDSLGGDIPATTSSRSAQKKTSANRESVGNNKRSALVRMFSFKLKDKWEEVDRGEHADALVTALKKMKHGEDSNDIDFTDVEKVLIEQYPGTRIRPTPFDMDESLRRTPSNGLLFGTGQWVEYYGGDAQWHLGMIRRVFAKAPLEYRPTSGEEPKWEYSYSLGRGLTVPPYLVRAPEEALKRAFGLRPFVFLQWALLRVESLVVFKHTHQRDFETMNFQYAAEMMWEQFLNHSSNVAFKEHFENHDENSQRKLIEHLLSVFAGMDRLSKLNAPGSRWDFKNQNISIYTYPSLLGSGWTTCLVILTLQLAIPALLLLGALGQSSARFTGGAAAFCRGTPWAPAEELSAQRVESLVMNLLVVLLYSFRIAPNVLDVFYQTIGGEGWTPASRLNALRTVVWNKGNDTTSMQIGFRLERLVKSVYMCIVCLVMLFVLFLGDSVLDIILNALAMEFIWQIDIEAAKSPYWDPKRRWIKAGAVECRIRATLDIHSLSSPKAFCAAYNIPLDSYKAAFGDTGDLPSLKSARIAEEDSMDENYMSSTDVVWHWAGEIARKHKLDNAIWQFSPENVHFGWLDSFKVGCCTGSKGVFRRFTEYRTWSVWEQVLFLSPVPSSPTHGGLPRSLKSTRDEEEGFDPEAQVHAKSRQNLHRELSLEYLNFDTTFHARTPFERFKHQVLDTLRFATLYRSLRVAWRTRQYTSIPFRLIDGSFEWLSYAIQVTFPLMLVGMSALVLLCY